MPLSQKETECCAQCGAELQSGVTQLGCMNCLLLGGPDYPNSRRRRFQHYEICIGPDGVTLDELGHGAMGITYRAQDLNLGSFVALKVISAGYSSDAATRTRFLHEAQAAAQLRHPNVASVFHFGETDTGECFYTMELIEGETLEARVVREGPMPELLALDVTIQVARALLAAETRQLIHRDLKPSNLMIAASDAESVTVKVIDFGLAKAIAEISLPSASGHFGFSGTPEFASPEQLHAGDSLLDIRSDIYSLGMTLWYLLCGQTPFPRRASQEADPGPLPIEQLTTARVSKPTIELLRSMLKPAAKDRPDSAADLLNAAQRCYQRLAGQPRRRRQRLAALGAAFLLLLVAGLGLSLLQQMRAPGPASTMGIAVLPFENLSDNRENIYFAEGMQDEILSNLARIADLKVISRSSVMQYQPGRVRNLTEIGSQLGVVHLLEGSVQHRDNRLRVNVHLIDTRTGRYIWAQTYDRDFGDVFAIQSDIAQAVAQQLRANISAAVRSSIEEPPTRDLDAYEFYIAARSLASIPEFDEGNLHRAILLLDRAIARDRDFFLAYCLSARTHSLLYSVFDHSPQRRELAERALQAAVRLRPGAGETHVAEATYLYRCKLDYEKARAELILAQHALPNSTTVFELMSSIDVFQGRWEESVRAQEKALELDPRNGFSLYQAAITYILMRRFAEAAATLDRAIALDPQDTGYRLLRAEVELFWRADTHPLHEIMQNDPAASYRDETAFNLALCERDAATAMRVVTDPKETGFYMNGFFIPVTLMQAWAAHAGRDEAAAQSAFRAARLEVARAVQAQPDYAPPLCVLGLIDAGLGQKTQAIEEGQRACALLPVAKDSINGELSMEFLALIYAWVGEKDRAIEQIAATLRFPGRLNYGYLRLHPFWDPLRGDPRFEKIVASLAPK